MIRWTMTAMGLAAILASACDDGGGDLDAGPADGDASTEACAQHSDCNDGLFCNGVERCAPGDEAANARGCVPAEAPACIAGRECREAERRCVTSDCSSGGDADGDGVAAIECGGADCDDGDANAFPGNVEVCDPAGVDEDCDPSTLGPDGDGDGYVSVTCCNGIRCGADCDDTTDARRPEGIEICNGIDEDCDGLLDEGMFQRFFRDLDGDGFGDPASGVDRACVDDPLFSEQADDCDDRDRTVYPGAPELCDGRDNDCSPSTPFDLDADRDGHLPEGTPCSDGPLPADDCDDADPLAYTGAPERCNARDDDCDGSLDEGGDAWCTDRARAGDDASVAALCGRTSGDAECRVVTCGALRDDCDSVLSNGCEVDLSADARNCGGCGVRCASGSCAGGLCQPFAGTEQTMVDVRAGDGGSCAISASRHLACWGELSPGLGSRRRLAWQRFRGGALVTDTLDVDPHRRCLCVVTDPDDDGLGELACGGSLTADDGDLLGFCDLVDATGVTALTPITGWDEVGDVAQGDEHGCAIWGAAGEVRCVGPNGSRGTNAASGDDDYVVTTASGSPRLSGGVRVEANRNNTCALLANGQVWCWGADNDEGQLGRGVQEPGPDPRARRVGTLSSVTDLAVGATHACALTGTNLFCWGGNRGYGLDPSQDETMVFPSPRLVRSDVLDVTIATDEDTTCVRLVGSPSRVICWGGQHPDEGALAGCDGAYEAAICDVSVAGRYHLDADRRLVEATSLDGGTTHTCAITDGDVRCWGDALPLGSASEGSTPFAVMVPPFEAIVEVDGGGNSACGRTSSGEVRCWGSNDANVSALGPIGTVGTPRDVRAGEPVGVYDALDISVGVNAACAVRADRTVTCWGGGGATGLDSGVVPTTGSLMPVTIPGLSDIVEVEVGGLHACARDTSGRVFCWGENNAGALGVDGGEDCEVGTCRATPVEVTGIDGDVAQLAAGGYAPYGFAGFTCARLVDGGVSCWGDNTIGTLGRGALDAGGPSPMRVPDLDDVVHLDASEPGICALRSDGRMMCWGGDVGGTLGTRDVSACGVLECAAAPVESLALRDVVRFDIGLTQTCASALDGRVWCWGGAGFGGVGPRPRSPVDGIAYPDQLVSGLNAACAILAEDVFCWGQEEHAFLAQGDGGEGEGGFVSPTSAFGL